MKSSSDVKSPTLNSLQMKIPTMDFTKVRRDDQQSDDQQESCQKHAENMRSSYNAIACQQAALWQQYMIANSPQLPLHWPAQFGGRAVPSFSYTSQSPFPLQQSYIQGFVPPNGALHMMNPFPSSSHAVKSITQPYKHDHTVLGMNSVSKETSITCNRNNAVVKKRIRSAGHATQESPKRHGQRIYFRSACDHCAQRKRRCDGIINEEGVSRPCSRCIRMGIACSIDPEAARKLVGPDIVSVSEASHMDFRKRPKAALDTSGSSEKSQPEQIAETANKKQRLNTNTAHHSNVQGDDEPENWKCHRSSGQASSSEQDASSESSQHSSRAGLSRLQPAQSNELDENSNE